LFIVPEFAFKLLVLKLVLTILDIVLVLAFNDTELIFVKTEFEIVLFKATIVPILVFVNTEFVIILEPAFKIPIVVFVKIEFKTEDDVEYKFVILAFVKDKFTQLVFVNTAFVIELAVAFKLTVLILVKTEFGIVLETAFSCPAVKFVEFVFNKLILTIVEFVVQIFPLDIVFTFKVPETDNAEEEKFAIVAKELYKFVVETLVVTNVLPTVKFCAKFTFPKLPNPPLFIKDPVVTLVESVVVLIIIFPLLIIKLPEVFRLKVLFKSVINNLFVFPSGEKDILLLVTLSIKNLGVVIPFIDNVAAVFSRVRLFPKKALPTLANPPKLVNALPLELLVA